MTAVAPRGIWEGKKWGAVRSLSMTNVANHKSAIYPHAMAHFSVVMHMVCLVNVLAAEFTVFKSN